MSQLAAAPRSQIGELSLDHFLIPVRNAVANRRYFTPYAEIHSVVRHRHRVTRVAFMIPLSLPMPVGQMISSNIQVACICDYTTTTAERNISWN